MRVPSGDTATARREIVSGRPFGHSKRESRDRKASTALGRGHRPITAAAPAAPLATPSTTHFIGD